MKRRHFLQAAAATPLVAALPHGAWAQQLPFNPQPGDWRTFEIVTRVEVAKSTGPTKVWIPLPSVEGDFQRTGSNVWTGNTSSAKVVSDGKYGATQMSPTFKHTYDKPGSYKIAVEAIDPRWSTVSRETHTVKVQ